VVRTRLLQRRSRWRTLLNFCWVQVVFARCCACGDPGTVVYVIRCLRRAAAGHSHCRGARDITCGTGRCAALLQRLLCGIVNLTTDRVAVR
jgi:hypothetical protein